MTESKETKVLNENIEAEYMVAKTKMEALRQEQEALLFARQNNLPGTNERKVADIRLTEVNQEIIEHAAILNELKVELGDYLKVIEDRKNKERLKKKKEAQKNYDRIQKLTPEQVWLEFLESDDFKKINIEIETCSECSKVLYNSLLLQWKRYILEQNNKELPSYINNYIPDKEYHCFECNLVFRIHELKLIKDVKNLKESLKLLIPKLELMKTNQNDLIQLIKQKFGGK